MADSETKNRTFDSRPILVNLAIALVFACLGNLMFDWKVGEIMSIIITAVWLLAGVVLICQSIYVIRFILRELSRGKPKWIAAFMVLPIVSIVGTVCSFAMMAIIVGQVLEIRAALRSLSG